MKFYGTSLLILEFLKTGNCNYNSTIVILSHDTQHNVLCKVKKSTIVKFIIITKKFIIEF